MRDELTRTFEGVMTIKWYKNDSGGDRRPLTIDAKDKNLLKVELNKVRHDFITKGENGKLPFSVKFEMGERE